MEQIDRIQIEEEDHNIFRKFTKQNNILQKLDFEIINDVHMILGNMINKTIEDNSDENDIVSDKRDTRRNLRIRLYFIFYSFFYLK